jgi:glucosylceramidase
MAHIALYTTHYDRGVFYAQSEAMSLPAQQPSESIPCITIIPDITFQTILGFGGAITDASAEVYANLSPDAQRGLMDAYFSPQGHHYSLIRTTIHSCDFSSESYTYIDE